MGTGKPLGKWASTKLKDKKPDWLEPLDKGRKYGSSAGRAYKENLSVLGKTFWASLMIMN